MESSFEKDLTPKRTPRKRASSAEVGVARKPAQKRTQRKKDTDQVAPVETSSVERKAPTMFAECQLAKRKRRRHLMIVGGLLVVGIGASAAVGYTDKGQIDVQQTIEDRNERIRTNTADARDIINSRVEVPVQNTNKSGKADGGLVGRAPGEVVQKPVTEVASTSATSSDQTASSTEALASSSALTTDENSDEGGTGQTPVEETVETNGNATPAS